MSDYRDLQHPGLNPGHNQHYRTNDNSSLGGVLIGLAVIGLVFLALMLFFGGSGGETTVTSTGSTATEQAAPATAPAQPSN